MLYCCAITNTITYFTGSETRLTESLSLIDAVTPDIVISRQNASNQQKQAKTDSAPGGEQNGVDVCILS